MTRRAKYMGPHLEVAVFDSEAGIYAEPVDIVKRTGLLGDHVPARIRDELLEGEEWHEVDQPAKTSKGSDD